MQYKDYLIIGLLWYFQVLFAFFSIMYVWILTIIPLYEVELLVEYIGRIFISISLFVIFSYLEFKEHKRLKKIKHNIYKQ